METRNTILIVEDDLGIAELLAEKVSECCFTPILMQSASEALEWLKSNTPFLMLLDYSLPDINGKEFIAELNNSHIQTPPFIVTTGQGDERIAVEMMKLGARDYIIKDGGFLDMISMIISKVGKEIQNENKLTRVEEALVDSNQFNNQIIQNVQEGIVVYDLNINVQLWNPYMERYSGIMAINILGKNPFELYPFFSDSKVLDNIKNALNGVTTLDYDYPFALTALGKSGWASDSATPLRNDTGEIIGVICIVRDITERKRVELELMASKEKAEESDCLKTSFLNNVSHEFRTPMNAIMGFSNLLINDVAELEQRQVFVNIIQTACDQLLNIVTDVVEISEIQAKQIKLIEKETHLQSIFDEVIDLYAQEAKQKELGFIFEVTLNEEHYQTTTDPYKLSKILKHLVSNAIKFTYSGFIKIECRLLNNQEYFFSVTDSGIGISEEMQQKIFEPFRQVETGTTRKYGGPGIGLSIAKAYIEAMGGRIALQSEINKGSTVLFQLPYKPKELHKDALPDKVADIDLTNKTILIAEDEYTNYLLLQEYLSKTNVKILHARNGIEALNFCRNNASIDLLLMDIKMPELDGFTAAKQIKIFRPDLSIVAQTAYSMQNDSKKYESIAFDDYITKPISELKLTELLKKYILL